MLCCVFQLVQSLSVCVCVCVCELTLLCRYTRQLNICSRPENMTSSTHTHTSTVPGSILTSLVTPCDNQPPPDSLLHQIGKLIKTTLAQLTPHTVRTVVTIAENKAPLRLRTEAKRRLERCLENGSPVCREMKCLVCGCRNATQFVKKIICNS